MMRMFRPSSLTARLGLLFTITAMLTFAVVGTYLYRALAIQLQTHDDHELLGKVQQFRHILSEISSSAEIERDPHRFIDGAAGHEGLLVVILNEGDRVLFHNGVKAPLPNLSVVPEKEAPTLAAIRPWMLPDSTATRTIAAWGRVGQSPDRAKIVIVRTASDRSKLLQQYSRQVLGASLGGALLAALFGYGLVRRAIDPVREVARQARTISAERLYTRLEAQTVPLELQALVQSFNEVLDRLEESFQRLSQFSADLAHDLRTPLYNLTMQTQVALSHHRSTDEYQALLSSSLEEYERLARMVESMLFLARADNAQVAVTAQLLDARTELQRIAEYFEGIADDAGVELVVEGNGKVMADPTLLRRAVSNLVANAIRFTPTGHTITLRCDQEQWGTQISVANPGQGIDAVHLPRVFDRFYRTDQSRSQSASAAGLGLAIVKSIMTLHGGRAEADSIPGKTTIFRLKFLWSS